MSCVCASRVLGPSKAGGMPGQTFLGLLIADSGLAQRCATSDTCARLLCAQLTAHLFASITIWFSGRFTQGSLSGGVARTLGCGIQDAADPPDRGGS